MIVVSNTSAGCDEVAAAKWIERHAARNQPLVTALMRDLDRGKAESIVLALELIADLVLLTNLVLLDKMENKYPSTPSCSSTTALYRENLNKCRGMS